LTANGVTLFLNTYTTKQSAYLKAAPPWPVVDGFMYVLILGMILKMSRNKKKQEIRAHMALLTRSEEIRAKSSYSMSSSKILKINRLI